MSMRCVNCGNVIADGQAFCNYCGTKKPEAEAQDAIFCKQCGRRLDPSERFCPKCGTPQ